MINRNECKQLCCLTPFFVGVFPIHYKRESADVLSDFVNEWGIPQCLSIVQAKEDIKTDWFRLIRHLIIPHKFIETNVSWKNMLKQK